MRDPVYAIPANPVMAEIAHSTSVMSRQVTAASVPLTRSTMGSWATISAMAVVLKSMERRMGASTRYTGIAFKSDSSTFLTAATVSSRSFFWGGNLAA